MTQNELLKIAYAQGVLAALEDSEITKEAGLGSALGRSAGWLGKKIFGTPGRWVAKGVEQFSPAAAQTMRAAGAGLPQRMMQQGLAFGGLGAGLSALQAPEGERLEAAAKGFVPGFLGGAGWAAGSNLGRFGLSRGVRRLAGGDRAGREAMANMRRANAQPWFTKKRLFGGKARTQTPIIREMFSHPAAAAKSIGAKALYGGIPFGTAWLASDLLSGVTGEQRPSVAAPASAAIYEMGQRALANRGYGMIPQTQAYPDNYGYFGYYG